MEDRLLHSPTYSESGILIDTDYEGWINFTEYKGCGMSTSSRPLHFEKNLPFLRPMSSMTEEEKEEFDEITLIHTPWGVQMDRIPKLINWLNANHFDYNGLIEKGLALEAPKGMYK